MSDDKISFKPLCFGFPSIIGPPLCEHCSYEKECHECHSNHCEEAFERYLTSDDTVNKYWVSPYIKGYKEPVESPNSLVNATILCNILEDQVNLPKNKEITVSIKYYDQNILVDSTNFKNLTIERYSDGELILNKLLNYDEHVDFVGYIDPEDTRLKESISLLNDYKNSIYGHSKRMSPRMDIKVADAITFLLPKFEYLLNIINDIEQNVEWRSPDETETD